MGGLFTPANWGTYVSTKHALESIAEAHAAGAGALRHQGPDHQSGRLLHRLQRDDGGQPFRWLDDSKNFTKRADLRDGFDDFFATPEGKMDPQEMIDRMIEIVPADTGKFRNVVPEGDRGHAEGAPDSRRGKPDLRRTRCPVLPDRLAGDRSPQ